MPVNDGDKRVRLSGLKAGVDRIMAAMAPTEASTTASMAHIPGTSSEYFILGGVLYQAMTTIASGDTIVTSGTGANCKMAPDGFGGEIASVNSRIKTLSNLPSGYQMIEYIESSGAQYISMTNSLNKDSRVVCTFAQTAEGVNVLNYLFGARNNTTSRAFFAAITGGGNVQSGYGTSFQNSSGGKANDTSIHTIDMNRNMVYLDGELVTEHSEWSGSSAETPYNSHVCAIIGTGNMFYGRFRIYRYTEYDNDVMVTDLVPCKRLSDNAIGMYDLMSESFRANQASGTAFTAGANADIDGIETRLNQQQAALERSQGVEGRLETVETTLVDLTGNPLPSGYQLIEYIESSAEQSINARGGSNYPGKDTRVVCTFAQTAEALSADAHNYLFGARNTSSIQGFYITIYSSGKVGSGFGAGKTTEAIICTDTDIHTIDKNKNLVYFDGELILTNDEWTGNVTTAPYPSRVCAIQGSTGTLYGSFRIYRYTEYDNDVMMADLIPCIRLSDNAIGMYDLVSESFRANEVSSTAFTAGPETTVKNLYEIGEQIRRQQISIDAVAADVSAIEADVNDMEDDIAEIKAGGGTVPDYVRTEADRVAAKVRGVQTGKTLTFVAVSDLHYSVYNIAADTETPETIQAALKDMKDGIKAIAGQTHIDFYACFGDVIYQWTQHGANYANGVQEMLGVTKLLNDAFGNNPQVRIVGNHDPNNSNSSAFFGAYELNSFVGIYSDILTRDEDQPWGGYGFHDFERQKIRVIVLNTSSYGPNDTITKGTSWYNLDAAQAQWLCGALNLVDGLAPKADPENWQIVLCSHCAIDSNGHSNVICRYSGVLDAYERGVSWNGADVSYNFAGKNAAELALYLNGHAHTYMVRNVNKRNTNGVLQYAMPLANLYIPNALPAREGSSFLTAEQCQELFGDADAYKYTKTAGTAESTAFQVITIDPVSKTVYAHHWGAGVDITLHYDPLTVTAETTLTTGLTNPVWYTRSTDTATVSGGVVTPVADGSTMIWCGSDTNADVKPDVVEAWNISVSVE